MPICLAESQYGTRPFLAQVSDTSTLEAVLNKHDKHIYDYRSVSVLYPRNLPKFYRGKHAF